MILDFQWIVQTEIVGNQMFENSGRDDRIGYQLGGLPFALCTLSRIVLIDLDQEFV